jgi:NhaP-type Na+/H+ or K+/H+ antiporter
VTSDPVYLIVGASLLLAVVLPVLFERVALSAPIVLIVLGVGVGLLPGVGEHPISPQRYRAATEHLTELTVIVALMGVGLALDRPLRLRSWRSFRPWASTWRLLLVAMPLCIAAVSVLGWWAMGLAPATALLLGSALAPTDPVLAADVQVEGPTTRADEHIDEHDEVRFALTSEAGLNDAFAFPFVYAAIYLAAQPNLSDWVAGWVATELLLKTAIGVAVGGVGGWALGKVAFRSRHESLRLAERGEPLLALAATLTIYGMTEMLHGWGFLAVFVAAMSLRSQERHHEYHEHMHQLIERLELLLTLLVLMLVGVSLSDGLLAHLTWQGAAVGLAVILIIRPACAWVALGRGEATDRHGGQVHGPRERLATAFFGVRGVGSIYYVAYALGQASFPSPQVLWATVGFTILASVLIHGTAATPVMRRLESLRTSRSDSSPG